MTQDRSRAFEAFVDKIGLTEFSDAVKKAGNVTPASAKAYVLRAMAPGYWLTRSRLEVFAEAANLAVDDLFQRIIALKGSEGAAGKPKGSHSSDARGISLEEKQICKFFGIPLSERRNPIQLVLPRRHLSPELRVSPFVLEEECKFTYKGGKCTEVWAEGVSGYLAYENVVAAEHVALLFMQKLKMPAWIRQENSQALRQRMPSGNCIISFGLGLSATTWITQKHFEPRLFEVGCEPVRQSSPRRFTECLNLQRATKRNDAATANLITTKVPMPKDGGDIALVARIVPISDEGETLDPYFICGGRTAPGTEAAGRFLAKRWKQLLALYSKSGASIRKDSLAVVIRHSRASKDGSAGPGVGDATSSIHHWNDEMTSPCIAFGRFQDQPMEA